MIYVPRHQVNLWSDYTFTGGALEGLTVGAGARYNSSYFSDAANTLEMKDRILVDASLKYDLGVISNELKDAQLTINATNLFDKGYVSACQSAAMCFYGEGRAVTASLRYKW